ncbi:MAG: hypothetical protein PHU71_03030 [Candidatus Gracilibacteria bacterium]|nr:hypothetical protein [Candidatus Gracilibacteria bacterium]
MNEKVQVIDSQDFVDIIRQPGVIETAELQRGGLKYVMLCRDCSSPNLTVELEESGFRVIVDRCQACRDQFDKSEVPSLKDVFLYYDLIKEE